MSKVDSSKLTATYCPSITSKWPSYNIFHLFVMIWMINGVVFLESVSLIPLKGFAIYGVIYILTTIFIGIPIVYMEISIAQYTNLGVIEIWKIGPLFRGVGYAMVYTTYLKSICDLVTASWYLQYTFYSTHHAPPWDSCESYKDKSCIMKRVNVTTFQSCLEFFKFNETQCDYTTSTYFFFEDMVGVPTSTTSWPKCAYNWKMLLCNFFSLVIIFTMTLKNLKYPQSIFPFTMAYIAVGIFALWCVSLSSDGCWQAMMSQAFEKDSITTESMVAVSSKAVLSLAPGVGMYLYLGKDVSFRSPANMTAIISSISSMIIALLICAFSKNILSIMMYYHDETKFIITEEYHPLFISLGRTPESITYLGDTFLWRFIWFSGIYLVYIQTQTLVFLHLLELLTKTYRFFRRHPLAASTVLALSMWCCSVPMSCTDLCIAASEAIEVLQLLLVALFIMVMAWFYNYRRLSNDILFMIGIKSSFFWKMSWIFSPFFLFTFLYLNVIEDISTFHFTGEIIYFFTDMPVDKLFYLILGGCGIILIVANCLFEIYNASRYGRMMNLISVSEDWGPKDLVLRRSRNMFVADIMTREFLYRQVVIDAYKNKQNDL